MAKRCLVVAYYFPPLGGGGVQRNAKLIKYLSREGWQFTVITSSEPTNLPKDEQLINDIPENVQVIKLPNSQSQAQSSSIYNSKSTFFKRWISSFFFIPDRHGAWIKLAGQYIREHLEEEEYDIVLISAPPYSLAILAADLTERLAVPVVLDMRDPWTTNPYKIYPTRWHYYLDRKKEIKAIQKIKYGISAYASLIDFYSANIPGFKRQNWREISNGFDDEDFTSLKPQKQDEKLLNIAFSGTFYSHINNPRVLLKAMASLDPEIKEKIVFHHIGTTHISLKQMAGQLGLGSNVVEWGYRQHEECLNILAGMDAFCFILDSRHPMAGQTIGGKVYEYIRLAKPVLALVPENGEAARLIKQCASGVIVDPYDTAAIKKLLSDWLINLPEVSSMESGMKYERSRLAQKYAEFFGEIYETQ